MQISTFDFISTDYKPLYYTSIERLIHTSYMYVVFYM